MKKVLSIVLYVLAIASIIFTVIEPNSEALGIPPAIISTGLLIIATIKEIIEKTQMLTPSEAADFTNDMSIQPGGILRKKEFTDEDVKEWRRNSEQIYKQ